jgi:hypothetical protein
MFRLKDHKLLQSALRAGYVLFDTSKVYENEKFFKNLLSKAPGYPAAPFHATPSKAPTDIGKVVIESGAGTASAPQFQVQTKLWRTQHGRDGAIKGFQLACKTLGLIVKASPADKKGGVAYRLSRPLDALLIHHPGPKRGWPLKNNPDGSPGILPVGWKGAETRCNAYTQ